MSLRNCEVAALGFAGISECSGILKMRSFLRHKRLIFHVPLNPTYELNGKLARFLNLAYLFKQTSTNYERIMSTIGEGILAMLESGPKQVSEIYEGVPGKRASIDKARWRLMKSGKIERVDHGMYRKKEVLGARPVGKISWEQLNDEEKSNLEC